MNILVIGDTHIPFEHKDYLAFCKETEREYKCEEVVHIGDLVDNHSMSYHEHDPNGRSPKEEMEEADKHLKEWYDAFPSLSLCKGNHDRLVDRKSKTVGLPTRVFKPFREIWNLPASWKEDWFFIINNVLYKHGTGYSGKYPHIQAAHDNRMSTVIGHCHSVSGVEHSASDHDIIFGMSVGSGIDRKTYAMAYEKYFKSKPILSCGVVTDNGKNALVVPMKL